jgi:hypothetical protein
LFGAGAVVILLIIGVAIGRLSSSRSPSAAPGATAASAPGAGGGIKYDQSDPVSVVLAYALALHRYDAAVIDALYPRESRAVNGDDLSREYAFMADLPEEDIDIFEYQTTNYMIMNKNPGRHGIWVSCGKRNQSYYITDSSEYIIESGSLGKRLYPRD